MTDLQKDQAIYKAMREIADKYFNRAVEHSEEFRKFMEDKSTISLKELKKSKEWEHAMLGYTEYKDGRKTEHQHMTFDDETIDVGTFHCEFCGDALFSRSMLERFKSLSKNHGEIYFTYTKEPAGEYVCKVSVGFENLKSAKTITEHCDDSDLRPIMNYVLMEVNTSTQSINFVASQGYTLAILSNKPDNWTEACDLDHNYQVLIPKEDWKRLIDYAKKNKTEILFEIYNDVENEETGKSICTMIANLGDAKIKFTNSIGCYPKWKSVLPDVKAMRRYEIHPDEIQALRKWQKSLSKDYPFYINVSVYKGSDRMYFDYCSRNFDEEYTASFRMKRPSPISEGIGLSLQRFRTMPFNGIYMQDPSRATYIVTDDFDLLLAMPMPNEDGADYVRNAELREVSDATMVEEPAMVAELQVA